MQQEHLSHPVPAPVDALVVLQRSDVDHLAAHRERFAGLRLLFIDPGIFDAALQAGLNHYELRRLDVGRDISALAYAEAMHRAASIDLALSAQRRALFGSGSVDEAFHGWDQNLLFLTLQRCFTHRAVGQAIERSFPEQRLGLLRPGNPALFNWDSMASADIVAADPARWSIVDGYAQGRNWQLGVLDLCFDFDAVKREVQAGRADCVSHIPTCFYDAPTFSGAVAGSFEHNVDLPGVYCDVPVRRRGEPLLRRLGDTAFDTACTTYRERARAVFTEHLAGLLPNRAGLALQSEAWARRSHLQAVNYLGLKRALAGAQPHFVISDHDVGSNGPLFSVAAELGSPITVLPHSAYPTTVLPHARRVTAIERDGTGVPVRTVLGQHVATRAVRFRKNVAAGDRSHPRRLCVLLNTMHSEGLSYVELFALSGFHRVLESLCERHGWALSVRLKPAQPALGVVSAALRKPADYFTATMALPIERVAQETDVCVVFGEATSGAIAFLDAGSYLLHVSEQDWPSDYVTCLPLKGALMRSYRCDGALAELEALMRDPARYAPLQAAQAAAFARRRADAHDTIFPHPSDSQGA